MKSTYFTNDLVQRDPDSTLDAMPIRVGDIVYLQLKDGSKIKTSVIFDTPLFGTTTYTSNVIDGSVRCGTAGLARFRHNHAHRIEPVARASRPLR